MKPTRLSLAAYMSTRAWKKLEDYGRNQVFKIAAMSNEFYMSGFWSGREKCWLLDGTPAYLDRGVARETACQMSAEFPDKPTRTWRVIQAFPGELQQLAILESDQ